MKKSKQLQKKVVMEAGIWAAIIAVTAGGMLLLETVTGGVEKQRRDIQTKVSTLRREAASGKDRLQSSGASMSLYEALRKDRDEMSLSIGREAITATLGSLKDKYRLSSLNLQLTPEAPYEDEQTKAAGVQVVTSDVRLDFGGMSDQHLFSFIADLQRKLPGFIRMKELSLNRNKTFDIESIRQISQGAQLEMVSGTMAFQWFGYPKNAKVASGGATQ